jgi:hypothetical protein
VRGSPSQLCAGLRCAPVSRPRTTMKPPAPFRFTKYLTVFSRFALIDRSHSLSPRGWHSLAQYCRMSFPARSRTSLACAAMALTAAFAVFGTDQAAASCGDWLADNGTKSQHATHDRQARFKSDPSAASRNRATTPCHGPHCGETPKRPTDLPPPVVRSSDQERFGCLSAALVAPAKSRGFTRPADDRPPPVCAIVPPDPPPRSRV